MDPCSCEFCLFICCLWINQFLGEAPFQVTRLVSKLPLHKEFVTSSMVEKRSTSPLVDPHSSVMQEIAPRAGDQTNEEDSNPQVGLAPKIRVKRARKQPRESEDDARPSKKSRRRGRLDLMPTMNLDILFHVRCKRTTFHTKLMNKSI